METQELQATNDIRYKVQLTNKSGETVIVKIRLNDECKNGHNDFSITGEVYDKGKPLIDKYCSRCGAMGEELAQWFPQFKIFDDLHLCDAKGAPMYAQANGFYHLKNSSKSVVMEYLRITEDEYNKLAIAEDQLYFTYILESLKIPERWALEALEAIKILEEWTGLKFEDDSQRGQFTPLTLDELTLVGERIKAGYYTPEAIEKRRLQAIEDKKAKAIAELDKELADAIKKHTAEHTVKMYVLLSGMPLDNFIYYTHSNEGAFNWKGYGTKVTGEQFDQFLQLVDYTKLPEGIKFKLVK